MPNTPYVSIAAFTAHPTYMDLDGLRVGSITQSDQDAELFNLLLMASQWADNQVNMPLGAHSYTQRTRAFIDRQGSLRFHSEHTPVIAVGSVGYGYSPTSLTTVSGANAWVEQSANVTVPLASGGPWSGSLEFGPPVSGECFLQASLTAGWVATTITAAAAPGASSITVADPTGIMPGQTYRIWEPGVEETVTIASTWTPTASGTPPIATAVPLASPLINSHTASHDFSALPAEIRLAITNYAMAMLIRPDSAVESAYPGTALRASVRSKTDRRPTDLVAEAVRILASYGRVR